LFEVAVITAPVQQHFVVDDLDRASRLRTKFTVLNWRGHAILDNAAR